MKQRQFLHVTVLGFSFSYYWNKLVQLLLKHDFHSTVLDMIKQRNVICYGFLQVIFEFKISTSNISWNPFVLRNWASEPDHVNNNEDCAILKTDGKFSDQDCNKPFNYICYKESKSGECAVQVSPCTSYKSHWKVL